MLNEVTSQTGGIMLPKDLIPKAERAIDYEELKDVPWQEAAIRIAPGSRSWVVGPGKEFDREEFMFTLPFDYLGREYTIYHGTRTGKYELP